MNKSIIYILYVLFILFVAGPSPRTAQEPTKDQRSDPPTDMSVLTTMEEVESYVDFDSTLASSKIEKKQHRQLDASEQGKGSLYLGNKTYRTQMGGIGIYFRNYRFRKHYENRKIIIWKCIGSGNGCQARVRSTKDLHLIESKHDHNHDPPPRNYQETEIDVNTSATHPVPGQEESSQSDVSYKDKGSSANDFYTFKTRQGNLALCVGNFVFRNHNENSNTINWQCTRHSSGCKARLTSTKDYLIIKTQNSSDHNHPPTRKFKMQVDTSATHPVTGHEHSSQLVASSKDIISSSKDAFTFKTKQGNIGMCVGNYNFKIFNEQKNYIYWYCTHHKYGCKARLISTKDCRTIECKNISDHNHSPPSVINRSYE